MIDLHIHTNHSDGTDDILSILTKAKTLGLEAISITDHDTVVAYDEFKKIDINKYYKGLIINGVELSTTFNKIPIEILGYNINLEKIKTSPCVDISRRFDIQKKYLQHFIKVGSNLGIKCNNNIQLKNNKSWASTTYFNEIKKYPNNYEKYPKLFNGSFYRQFVGNKNSPFYIDENKDLLDINFIIDEIHRCDGKAFLAHLFQYNVNHIEFLKEIIKTTKIDGIECFYSWFNDNQTNQLLILAKENNLLISGGSDYHGNNKKDIKLGTGVNNNLNIPFDVIKEWVEK